MKALLLVMLVYMLRGSTVMRCLAWAFAVTAVVNPYVSDISLKVLSLTATHDRK
jgi:hypothetical protein